MQAKRNVLTEWPRWSCAWDLEGRALEPTEPTEPDENTRPLKYTAYRMTAPEALSLSCSTSLETGK
jgi:hypothetical protein